MSNIFKLMESIANEQYDGHYTIMKFTTNYRFCFGTLFTDSYDDFNNCIRLMSVGKTLDEAISNGILNNINCYNIRECLNIKNYKELTSEELREKINKSLDYDKWSLRGNFNKLL